MWMLLVKLLFSQGIGATDIKTWTADTNFENPRNWPDGKLPCSNDRIIFPKDANLITLLPSQLSFAEMVLPMDGELVFRDGSNLVVTGGTQEGSCQGQDVHFTVSTDYWYDPNNWNISSSRAYPEPNTPRKNLAVPHALRLPCKSDKVIFPKDASFKSYLDVPEVSVGTIEINGVGYDNEEFQDLLSSRTGNFLFPGNSKVVISGSGCDDITGCKCSNDDPQVIEKVCIHVTCQKVECSDGIRPTGHCCPLCGAYLEIEYGMDFQIEKLMEFLKTYLAKADFKEVESFTFKTYKDSIQAIFVDGGKSKGAAAEIAQTLHEQLSKDMERSNSYKLRSVKAFISQNWNYGVPTKAFRNQGMSGGGIVALIFVILCLIGLAVAWYIYKKRQIPGFNFARFDLHSNKVELELGTTPHEDLDPEASNVDVVPSSKDSKGAASTKAFDNPIYDVPATGYKTMTKEKSESSEDIVENPMFMLFEDPQGESK